MNRETPIHPRGQAGAAAKAAAGAVAALVCSNVKMLLKSVILVVAFALCGCATRHATPTETARLGVTLHRAAAANTQAAAQSARIGTDLERIDAKNGVLLKWLEAQP